MDEAFRSSRVTLNLAQLDVLDILTTFDHLLRRDANLVNVFTRLFEMRMKIRNPIVEAQHILQQGLDFALYDTCLFAHLRVLENRTDGIQRCHQRRR